MPRPPKCRTIDKTPDVTYFKPRGVPLRETTEAYLTVDGLEAMRLADLEGLDMETAASRMNVSRHTFGRILGQARRAAADALVNGRALRIEGGRYRVGGAEAEGDEPETEPGGACPESKESKMTKIAISSEGPNLEDRVDPRFGRAGGFVVVDAETMSAQYLPNGQAQAMAHGAGIDAAERVAAAGAEVVLTGFVGPKAFRALNAAGVKVGQDLGGMTVGEAVEKFKSGQVTIADRPNK
jgi:predicted DNA-binding protein (UPF0251 family)/predicted Fe-Mo cluster-binding NifX family protein